MKIWDLDQPRVGDIVEFETDPDTVVEGVIVGETEDGYIYEFGQSGYTALDEACLRNKSKSTDLDEDKDPCWDDYKQIGMKNKNGKKVPNCVPESVTEAEYHGRDVPLGRPMRGDVKKFKVYVKNKAGKVVKVNFGDPNMRIKKSNPARRKSFRARHNCKTPGPRDKARYWSCRKW